MKTETCGVKTYTGNYYFRSYSCFKLAEMSVVRSTIGSNRVWDLGGWGLKPYLDNIK